MKHIAQITVAFLVALLSFASRAGAHDGWIELSPSIVEKGQPVTIVVMQGNHSNGHKSFRLAGKWDPEYTKLLAIDPKRQQIDLTSRLIDMGEDAETIGPKGPKGFHLASFVADKDGVYRFQARQERVVQFGEGPKVRSVRTATSALTALGIPTVAAARKLRWFDEQVGPNDALEIVPTKNLLGIREGEPAVLRVRHKGKPAGGQMVSVLRKIEGASSAQEFTTNPEGLIHFVVGPADYYLLRTNLDEAGERAAGQYEKSSYEATYVFQAFRR